LVGYGLTANQIESLHDFWIKKVRNNQFMDLFYTHPPDGLFTNSNYLLDRGLFETIKSQVSQNKITYSWIDITSSKPVETFFSFAFSPKKDLFDFSNVQNHIPSQMMKKFVSNYLKHAHQALDVFVLTQLTNEFVGWAYLATTDLPDPEKIESVVSFIEKNDFDKLDGRFQVLLPIKLEDASFVERLQKMLK
jgi:hypothetical protein